MATLATLLVRLGFDISGMPAQAAAARGQMGSVAQAAQQITTAATPAAVALRNLSAAARSLEAGSRGTAIREIGRSIEHVAAVTNNSVPALYSYARSVAAIADSTESAIAVNAFSRSVSMVADVTRGSIPSLRMFNEAMVQIAASGGEAALVRVASAIRAGIAPMNAVAAETRRAAWAAQEAEAAEMGLTGSLTAVDAAAMRASVGMRQLAASEDMAANRGSFLNRTLSMAFAFSGGVAVTNVFSFLANALVGFNSRLEQAHIAFSTLLGDDSKADAFLEKMKQFANVTPFTFASLQDAVQRLLAMGFAADQVLPALRAVGDAVAALGGDKDKLDRVTLALGQMITAGRVNSQDMRQLTEAGIPAWQILADAIGKTVAETRKLAEEGILPANQAVSALLAGMEAKFGGMMARQARTAQGAASTIFDALTQVASKSVSPIFDAISKGMVAMADFLVNGGEKVMIPAIQAIGVALAFFIIPRLWGIVEGAAAASVSLEGLTVAFTRIPIYQVVVALTALAIAWQENFGNIRTTLGPLVDTISNFAGAILNIATSSGLLVPIITIVASVITTKFVVALIASFAAMLGNTFVAIGLSGAFANLALDAGAATVSVSGFAIASKALLPIVGGLAGIIGIWVGILVVVATKWDELARGVDAARFIIVAAIKGIWDAMATLGGVPTKIKDAVDAQFNAILDEHTASINALTAKIDAANAQGAVLDPLGPTVDKFKIDTEALLAGTEDLVTRFGQTIKGIDSAAAEAGDKAMRDMAKAIMEGQQAPIDALLALRDASKNALSLQDQTALDFGILQSRDLAQGLISGIPAVKAAAIAVQKTVIQNLADMGYAYEAGRLYINAYEAGIASGKLLGPPAPGADITPSIDAATDALAALNKRLAETANASALSALGSAFNDIRQTAHRFFDQLHQDNLQAIDDALRHKNAIIDAKEALNQAPVTAAQKALDYQRRVIEEWRLRNAIATAQSPEAYRDAVLALQDFLAQQHINDMQSQVDQAKDKLDAQKQHNEDVAARQRDAENDRYQQSVAAFDRDLELLEKHLAESQTTWQDGEDQILALLSSYGVKYGTVGASLGLTFVANLRDQIDAAITALKLLENGLTSTSGQTTSTQNTGKGGVVRLATGSWEIMQNELLAYVHRGEMVVPATAASQLRRAMMGGSFGEAKDGGSTFGSAVSGFARTMQDSRPNGGHGGGTVVLKVGDEALGEITDRRLSVQDDIYSTEHHLGMASQR